MHSNRQLEPPLIFNFSCRIFRHSALDPNFSFDPIFLNLSGDMGSLVHSREYVKVTAVSVTSFHADLVAEVGKRSSRLNLRFLVLYPSIFFTLVEEQRSSYSSFKNRLSFSSFRNTSHIAAFSLPMPALTPSTRWPCYDSVFMDRAAEEQRSTFYTADAPEL